MAARADVYAAGLILYEMLTGLPPESCPHLGDQAREVAENPALRALNQLMLRACEADPGQRFANAGEMLAQLSRRPKDGWPVGRLVFAGIVCLLVVLMLTAWRLLPRRLQLADVNFITEPFEATISMDGKVLLQPWPPGTYSWACVTLADVITAIARWIRWLFMIGLLLVVSSFWGALTILVTFHSHIPAFSADLTQPNR